jgi:hypothetical protein
MRLRASTASSMIDTPGITLPSPSKERVIMCPVDYGSWQSFLESEAVGARARESTIVTEPSLSNGMESWM